VRGVRGELAKNDIVFEAKLLDVEGLVRPEAVTYQHSWFLISPCLCLEVKYLFHPLQADIRVIIARFRASIDPSRSRVRRPVASMGGGWPDDHWVQRLTACRYTLDRSHRRPLDTSCRKVNLYIQRRDRKIPYAGMSGRELTHLLLFPDQFFDSYELVASGGALRRSDEDGVYARLLVSLLNNQTHNQP